MFTYLIICIVFSCNICGLAAILYDPCLKLFANSQSYGGVPQSPAIDGDIKCWRECQKTPWCKAFEWLPNNSVSKCFLFTTSDPPFEDNKKEVFHYVNSCQCLWKLYSNARMFNGQQQTYTTLDLCQKACLMQPNCKAVEWKTLSSTSPRCFFFDSSNLPQYLNVMDINHYIWGCQKNSVPRMTTSFMNNQYLKYTVVPGCFWSFEKNFNSANGIKKPSVLSLQQCKTECMKQNKCMYGLDWNPEAKNPSDRCWISVDMNKFMTMGVNHYSFNCSTGSLEIWKVKIDTNTYGGQVQPTIYTLQECKEFCLSLTPCHYGFDWNRKAPLGQGCWISTRKTFHSANILGHVDHYDLTQMKNAVLETNSNCTWKRVVNYNSPNGSAQPLYETLEECQAYCIKFNHFKCKGIDWNPNSDFKCWFSLMDGLSTYPGITHYSLQCPDVTTPAPKGPTTKNPSASKPCGYVKFPNSSSENGIGRSYKSDGECRDQCTVQISCKAYEWRNVDANSKCWFYNMNDVPKFNNTSPGNTYYLYKNCAI